MLHQALKLWLPLVTTAQHALCSSDELPQGVLKFSLEKPGLEERLRLFRRDDDTTDVTVRNHVTMFSASLEMGSDKQNVTVLVDTGSSDLWVMSAENPYCSSKSSTSYGSSKYRITEAQQKAAFSSMSSDKINCYEHSQFEPSSSDSFSMNDTSFHITYGDGSFANGTYVQDTISYGGATIKNANFAFANETDSEISVWGIGYAGLESTVTTYDEDGNFSPTYSNLPMQMKEQGIIEQIAYSLWLNDLDASQGTLLFGGVDHSKYTGSLQKVPVLSSYPGTKPSELHIKLDKVTLYQDDNSADIIKCAYPALLDSGTSFMMLPEAFLEAILDSIGGTYASSGNCFASCDLEGGLKFDFSGVTIDVDFQQLLFQTSSASSVCQLGILPSSNTLVLGDTFLRSAYVVYDLENNEIALAQAQMSASGSASIEAITSGIPSASKASGYSSSSVGNSYSTTTATFVSGASDVGNDVTSSSLGGSGPASINGGGGGGSSGGSHTSEAVPGGGTVFSTLALSTMSRSGGSSSSGNSGSNIKVSLFGSLFSSIMGALLYF